MRGMEKGGYWEAEREREREFYHHLREERHHRRVELKRVAGLHAI